jgi:hypothetical protein
MTYTHAHLKLTKFVCKYCKVQVIGKNNHAAILGQEHKKSCPRKIKGS